MNEPLILNGCSPTPLAHYLKALGILRIIDEQLPEAGLRGYWKNETFAICGELNEADLTKFFLHKYAPSAVVAPWNGGSGFHPKDNKTAISAIGASTAARFGAFRQVIAKSEDALKCLGLKEKPSGEDKSTLLALCRNTFPDAALGWLDAAFVLTKDGTRYPPLLGTGGNDGRLDFTNNFMQRLTEVFDTETGEPTDNAPELLGNALFGHTVRGLANNAIGQFGPASSGGANASSGFSAKAAVNPWDFILMLEGAILFAAASVKRLQTSSSGQLAYPFSVRTTGAGYGSASGADEPASASRCEMWMPLWTTPTSCTEIRSLLSEGRAQVGMRPARDGLDFHRAITNLGVERGISAFQRYGFLVRNGLAYFATPMERVTVQRNEAASELLSDLDRNNWLDTFRRNARADNSPGSVLRASRQLERAIIGLCTASQQNAARQVREMLVALGGCEQALANCIAWTKEKGIRPIPLLGHRWLSEAAALDDPSNVEFRLAAALASLTLLGNFGPRSAPLRGHLEPVEVLGSREKRWVQWNKLESRDVVGLNGHLPDRLNQIIHRRLLLSAASGHVGWQESSSLTAQLSDVAIFLEGSCDTKRLSDFLAGLALLNWADPKVSQSLLPPTNDSKKPSAAFALLKLCHQAPKKEGSPIPLDRSIHRLAAAGQIDTAVEKAIRRLKSSGLSLAATELKGYVGSTKNLSAALLFPLWSEQIKQLEKIAHAASRENPESSNPTTTERNVL
jgi:CRISPR-associated protein Csx17